jgi:hypothetical protein
MGRRGDPILREPHLVVLATRHYRRDTSSLLTTLQIVV